MSEHEHHVHPGEDQCRCGLNRREIEAEALTGCTPCSDCGTDYAAVTGAWLVSDELWQQVETDPSVVLCPTCFIKRLDAPDRRGRAREPRTLAEAIEMVDGRFRALAGVGEDEAMMLLAERENFRPLLLGLPVDAGETIEWISEATRRTIMLAGAGNEPDAALFGALLAAFMAGALVDAGD